MTALILLFCLSAAPDRCTAVQMPAKLRSVTACRLEAQKGMPAKVGRGVALRGWRCATTTHAENA